MDSIQPALQWRPLIRARPIFDFFMSTEAADTNFALLQDNDFDLERILLRDGLSPLHPGSEFRPVSLLQPIFEAHHFGKECEGHSSSEPPWNSHPCQKRTGPLSSTQH